jgi:hypothetical protein
LRDFELSEAIMSQSEYQAPVGEETPRASIAALAARPVLTEEDVNKLRRRVLRFGFVTRAEAEALFEIDAAPSIKCDAWTALFVEALTDHVVWQSRPTGVVSPEQAEWLLSRVDRACTVTRLALLVNILGEAHSVPRDFLTAVKTRAANWPGLEALIAAA